jgi:hypothetical protein
LGGILPVVGGAQGLIGSSDRIKPWRCFVREHDSPFPTTGIKRSRFV